MVGGSVKLARIQEHARQTVLSQYKLAFSVGGAAKTVGNTFRTLGSAASEAGQSFKKFHGLKSMDAAGKLHDYSMLRNLGNSAKQFHNLEGTKALGQVAAGTALAGAGAYGAKRLLSGNPPEAGKTAGIREVLQKALEAKDKYIAGPLESFGQQYGHTLGETLGSPIAAGRAIPQFMRSGRPLGMKAPALAGALTAYGAMGYGGYRGGKALLHKMTENDE